MSLKTSTPAPRPSRATETSVKANPCNRATETSVKAKYLLDPCIPWSILANELNPPRPSTEFERTMADFHEMDMVVGAELATLGKLHEITDGDRYRWIMENCIEASRDANGEEISYFLHFDGTEDFESVQDAIDRHIRGGSKEHLS